MINLTDRQRQLANLVLQGKSNEEMATLMNLKTNQVVRYAMKRLFKKYGTTTRSQFMAMFVRIPPSIKKQTLDPTRQVLKDLGLSKREIEIGFDIIYNLSTQEISERNKISEASVRNAIYRINQKLNINSRDELKQLFTTKVHSLPKTKILNKHNELNLLPKGNVS